MPLFNIQLGEVVFGGVGAGLYGMLVMAILSVFIAGLMVGRTPEYLGKKIEAREMKLAMLYVLIFPLVILGFSAWSAVAPYGLSSLNNAGPHGLSEILYAFTSAAGNNGSAFAGSQRQHALVQHRARPRHAGRALPDDRARSWPSPARWPARRRARRDRARSPPTARSSRSCSWA